MYAFVSSFVGAAALKTSSFNGQVCKQTISSASSSKITMMAKSKAIPFLDAPSKLDGKMVGDVGFDPVMLSENINLEYARAAELKHGRICMLATLGFVFPEIFHLPGPFFSETHPLAAIYKVPAAGWAQIIVAISLIELFTFRTQYEGKPGELGFDPLNLGKGSNLERYKLAELKNGRLAMMGFLGFFMQELVTKQSVLEQLKNFKPLM